MKEYVNCVIVGKDGYFDQVKVKEEEFEQYSKFVIGETINGYKKLKFPGEISYMSTNGVLNKVGKVKPETIERIKKSLAKKEERTKAIQDSYKNVEKPVITDEERAIIEKLYEVMNDSSSGKYIDQYEYIYDDYKVLNSFYLGHDRPIMDRDENDNMIIVGYVTVDMFLKDFLLTLGCKDDIVDFGNRIETCEKIIKDYYGI